ncbi:gamma-glutamylcyclotransferase [Mucilaginibacter corticis]|uniref:Gamma-glutamylcyclotransferase n=1 Tax=Mucilaginibacter corticis TaxID=2597670 RepID=A0A556MHM8_9SPHI|nr:gamma-glutamylcyclotransferase family protein [Mucilaginibacter corticis]TSJ39416.1 gamma-glutamylcyclotransferase [Mucilaginibacter corticis]
MILFAYAGNMNVEKFKKTVPSAHNIGVAKLPGYSFVFNSAGEDESAKANVVKSFEQDAVVWGLLIELDDEERSDFYDPMWSSVLKLEPALCFDLNDNIYHAEVFVTQPHAIITHLLPYDWYHAKILKLAKDANLPATYITQIALMPYKVDPDEIRRQRRLKNL